MAGGMLEPGGMLAADAWLSERCTAQSNGSGPCPLLTAYNSTSQIGVIPRDWAVPLTTLHSNSI